MVSVLTTLLIFLAVIFLTAVVFGGWVVVMVVKLIWGAVTRVLGPDRPPQPAPNAVRCTNEKCRASNPKTAQFCRRCGRKVGQVQTVGVRRVAMW